jgi:phenylalanyl-tRNA synthetase alpha chain
MPSHLSATARAQALQLRDLTDPAAGPHAMQAVVERITAALTDRWGCRLLVDRGQRIVSVADNYELLGYAPDAAARDSRYTRYVSDGEMLRSHTSAAIPGALRRLAAGVPDDVLIACPGLVWRRDVIGRLHTGEPHQLDLWRIARRPLDRDDLREMIATVVEAVLPGTSWRGNDADHPYTTQGLEVEAAADGGWVEIGECGLAGRHVLENAGIRGAEVTGLAMGLGLDRLLMLRKGIPDIRLLRSADPRIASQMLDPDEPYRAVSSMPPVRRDISIAVAAERDAEQLGDLVREALGDRAAALESVEVLSETPGGQLPAAAVERIGLRHGQKNVLLRMTIRSHDRTLTDAEANQLRNDVYAAVHEGGVAQWAV